jgi:uncharacterized membrane protein (UPF0136 family)
LPLKIDCKTALKMAPSSLQLGEAMTKNGTITTLYALLVIVGGAIGYLAAGSIPSLVASAIIGSLLLLASIALFRNRPWGLWVALAITLFVAGFFSWRFATTLAWIPLIMIATSCLTFAGLWKNRQLT